MMSRSSSPAALTEMAAIEAVRAAGVHGLILGEALFNGSVDYSAAGQMLGPVGITQGVAAHG